MNKYRVKNLFALLTGILLIVNFNSCKNNNNNNDDDNNTGSGTPCPGVSAVNYGGITYNTVLIGDQCWIKENLNIGTMIHGDLDMQDNGIIEKYCYENDESNCEIYGGLYQWDEIMHYSNVEGTQGICPPGWHIPTEEEWCTLTMFIDTAVDCQIYGNSGINACEKMKAIDYWYEFCGKRKDVFGFSALPGGEHEYSNIFNSLEFSAEFWSSTAQDDFYAWCRLLECYEDQIIRESGYIMDAFSVRCIKNLVK